MDIIIFNITIILKSPYLIQRLLCKKNYRAELKRETGRLMKTKLSLTQVPGTGLQAAELICTAFLGLPKHRPHVEMAALWVCEINTSH